MPLRPCGRCSRLIARRPTARVVLRLHISAGEIVRCKRIICGWMASAALVRRRRASRCARDARAGLSHRRRAQHQQLPARRAGRRASAAALGNRAAHSRRISRRQQRGGAVVREHAKPRSNGSSSRRRKAVDARSTMSVAHCMASNSKSRRMRRSCARVPRFSRRCACCATMSCRAGAGRSAGRGAHHRRPRFVGARSPRWCRGLPAHDRSLATARACRPSDSLPRRRRRCACGFRRSRAKRRSSRSTYSAHGTAPATTRVRATHSRS